MQEALPSFLFAAILVFYTATSGSLQATPPPADLYFSLNGVIHLPGESVSITDIGSNANLSDAGSTLVCMTSNVNTKCCRNSDGGRVGEWFYPNGTKVPRNFGTPADDIFTRSGYTEQVRLNRQANAVGPLGVYRCDVPAEPPGAIISASIMIGGQATISSSSSSSSTPPSSPPFSGGTEVGVGTIVGVAFLILVLIAAALVISFLVVIWIWRRRQRRTVLKSYNQPSYSKVPPPRPAPPASFVKLEADDAKVVDMNSVTSKVAAPVIEEFPEARFAVEGEEVYLKVRVSGTPTPSLVWTFENNMLTSDYSREIEQSGCLSFPSCEVGQSGVYTMMARNSSGTVQKQVRLTVNTEDEGLGGEQDVAEMDELKPMATTEFGNYVARLHGNNNKLFKALFSRLDSGGKASDCKVSKSAENIACNRFANISVYDNNRVVLKTSAELSGCHGDYINASYIAGFSVPKKFIATQGPLPGTVLAFWRMVWQERPPTIVMVTNLVEMSKTKCTAYWPEQGSMDVGPFLITITDHQKLADYTIRAFKLELREGGAQRPLKLQQFHFTAWPDHGVPDYASPLLAFHRRVLREHPPNKGPIVIHCSAGVGRTGTFIGLDIILEQAQKQGDVDVVGTIKKMRTQRVYMVQALEQFVFVHDAVLESLTCGDTQIEAGNLRAAIKRLSKTNPQSHTTGFNHEFKVLEQVSLRVEEAQCNIAKRYPNLNRGSEFLPVDRWCVILKSETGASSYLHAVQASGYKQQSAFIIAQTPLPATLHSLWKVIYDRKLSVIMQLTALVEEGREVCTPYWPRKVGEVQDYQGYTVDLINEEHLDGFTVRTLSVLEHKSQKSHQVIQFHITCWNGDGTCSNLESVTNSIDRMGTVQRRTNNHPIMVLCNDTVGRSSMFCSVVTTIERCKLEGMVDVFQVVKALRIHRPGAVQTLEQYKIIFDIIVVFLDSFSTYANFL